jgi:hypothetical protein
VGSCFWENNWEVEAMAKDTVSLVLGGDVPLATFARVMGNFSALIRSLSDEVVGPGAIEWEISHLEGGSATAVVRGIYDVAADVERVVQAYGIVGQCLEQARPVPYSDEVVLTAKSITSILDGKVRSVEFVTDDYVASITEPLVEEEERGHRLYSLGTVRGVIETISLRGRLKFTLYDDLFDRAVHCYPDEGQREHLRKVWGKHVSVSGWIYRDPDMGRPLEITRLGTILILEDFPPDSYKAARGVMPWRLGDELPEVLIRRLRDA